MDAATLIERIQDEKREAVSKGLLRAEKPLATITELEKPHVLPDGWAWCRLGDYAMKVTDYVASGSFASLKENVLITNEENYAIMVKTADFSNGFSKNLTYTDERGYRFLENSNLFGGELILSNIGSIGKVFMVPNLHRPMTLASNTVMIRMTHNEYNKYMYYLLKSPFGQKALTSISSGTSMQKFNKTQLKSVVIPVAPFEEQSKICNTLDKISRIIELRKQELRQLDDLIKARFVEMFGDFKLNPMDWPIVSFDDIAIIDGNMTTDYERFANYPHIGIDSIEKDTGILKGYRTVAEDGVISGKYVFTPKHIIYSKIRPNLNKVALPSFNGLCSADAYPILPVAGKCNRAFLAYNMRSPYFLDYILQFCNRTNLPKVNRKEIAGFKTPLPPIELQNDFSNFVAQVDKSKIAMQKALVEAQTLFDSLMQKYYG